jgi:predicted nucleic acid-binding protein
VWLITEEILGEYQEVLLRLKVSAASRIIRLIKEEAEQVRLRARISGLPHEEDAVFAECAESGHADFLVTLNPRHFPQEKLRAKVIAPTDPLPTRVSRRRRRPKPIMAGRKKSGRR